MSVLPLMAIWAGALLALRAGLWPLTLALLPLAAGFLLRVFIIQHDCGHRSFFSNMKANDWLGRALGILTFTPHDWWRRTHAIHHATSSDLDRRGLGAVDTLTVEEYRALPRHRQFIYRLYRHPVVLFVIGPPLLYLFQQRIPVGLMRDGWRPWVSAMGTNLGLVGYLGAAYWIGGWAAIGFIIIPTTLLAAAIGVWLFYIQHQFEGAYWVRHKDWDLIDAALNGSTYYDLPAPLHWLTGNIGVHHVHHAAARIPFYTLPKVLKDYPELANTKARLGVWESIRCIPLALWDEANQQLISFRQLRQLPA